MPPRLLCIAEQWGSAAYLAALARRWVASPPAFDWRLAASEPLIGTLRDDADLAPRLVAIDPSVDHLEVGGWRASTLLVSAGGLRREFAFVAAGRDLGLDVIQFVDTWYGYGRRFIKDDVLIVPDRILVIDDMAVEEASAEGVPARSMTAVGHPVWESIERLPPTASRDVLFLDAPVARDYGRRLGYTEDECWAALCAAKQSRPDLIGRILFAPHPDHVRRVLPADVAVTRYHADLLKSVGSVVGMFSAPLVDAYLAGRRSITVQPNATEIDMCPLSRHGRIARRRTVEQLVAAFAEPAPDAGALAASLAGSARRATAAIEAVAA